jgi:hypothetical protein
MGRYLKLGQVFKLNDCEGFFGFNRAGNDEKPRMGLVSFLDITRIEAGERQRSGKDARGTAYREKPD